MNRSRWRLRVLTLSFVFLMSSTTSTVLGSPQEGEWRPLDGGEPIDDGSELSEAQPRHFINSDPCTLHKVVMHQDNYYQYVQYKTRLPDLKEFTICTWHKFYNHSVDHPIFSYSLRDRPREIVSWVSNTDKSSFYTLTIAGTAIYRVNYPVRLHRWYHSCQSWNGRTGEWQLWVNSERVGRGFYNILVGRVIKGGGIAMTGQESRSLGGQASSGGLAGEVTLVQVYKAALTQGKAYTDHKHHHAHKFHHEDQLGEDDPEMQGLASPQQQQQQALGVDPLQQGAPTAAGGTDPLVRGGQLVPRLPIDELSVLRQQQAAQQAAVQQQVQQSGAGVGSDLLSPFSSQSLRLFKRDQKSQRNRTIEKRHAEETSEIESHIVDKRQTTENGAKEKRTLDQTQFGLIPGVDLSGFLSDSESSYVLGASTGSLDVGQKLEGSMRQMEPAEWEVRSIMGLCSGCGQDPFRKANVLSWRETSKKVFGGALYVPANQQCHNF